MTLWVGLKAKWSMLNGNRLDETLRTRVLLCASATLAVDNDDDRLRTIAIGMTYLPFVTLLPLSVMLTIPLLSCWTCFSICLLESSASGYWALQILKQVQDDGDRPLPLNLELWWGPKGRRIIKKRGMHHEVHPLILVILNIFICSLPSLHWLSQQHCWYYRR